MIVGFDTETMEGPPITVQFYSDHRPKVNACIFVDRDTVLKKTLAHLEKHCRGEDVVCVGHNLKFDLLSLFYPVCDQLVASRYGDFEFTYQGWTISGVYGVPTFARIVKGDIRLLFIDGFSWFRTSLAQVAKLLCPDLPKLKAPEGLGTRMFTARDDDFVAYAMRDAQVSFHQGVAIAEICAEFDIDQPVSVADMASRIFQRGYIIEPIHNTGPRILEGAVKSYHGGKNNVVQGAAPAWHSHVDAWDLSSAYPHAMTQLPAFSNPRLFAASRVFNPRTRTFPDHGVYCISGKVPRCDWPVIFDHSFKPIQGPFENIWVTGWELNEARRAGEITLSRVHGHVYDTDRDPVTHTAFQAYCEDFYQLKSNATDPVRRYMYKTLLNSLYGKFIQSREVEAHDGGTEWRHGPLFHPFAASLITGHTRAVIHRLEHETQAIHTATDGVFCGANNSPANGFDWAPDRGLGSIECEGRGCELLMLRNKLYILYSDDATAGYLSFVRPGKYIAKAAKHGFQGTVKDLEELVMHNRRKYVVETPNTLRIALRDGRTPNKFERREMVLKVAPLKVHFNHAQHIGVSNNGNP